MPSFEPPQTAPVTGYAPPSVAPTAPSPTAPAAYQPPAAAAAPAAYQPPAAAPAPTPPNAYQAPAGYPPPPSYPAAPTVAEPAEPAAAAEVWWTQAEDDTQEKVGRGLLFALGGVVAGIVLAIFVWQMGFVASLTGAVMAYACVWLYAKGAGQSPRKGAFGLLGLILAGVLLSLVGAIGSDAVIIARKVFPNDTARQTDAVIAYLTTPEVWSANAGSVVMYLIFAALGTYSIFIGLAKARKG
jgi:hypothetical protein